MWQFRLRRCNSFVQSTRLFFTIACFSLFPPLFCNVSHVIDCVRSYCVHDSVAATLWIKQIWGRFFLLLALQATGDFSFRNIFFAVPVRQKTQLSDSPIHISPIQCVSLCFDWTFLFLFPPFQLNRLNRRVQTEMAGAQPRWLSAHIR